MILILILEIHHNLSAVSSVHGLLHPLLDISIDCREAHSVAGTRAKTVHRVKPGWKLILLRLRRFPTWQSRCWRCEDPSQAPAPPQNRRIWEIQDCASIPLTDLPVPVALWHKLVCQSPPDRDLAHNRVLALSKLPAHCDAGDVRHYGQVGRQRGGGVRQGRRARGVLRRDLDAEVLVQIVGRALLNHCEAHFVEPTGGGHRQLKTERKI